LQTQGNSRLRVKQLVFLSPGVHLRELQRLLGMSFNSTRYHVDRLTKSGEIVRFEEGGYSRLYPRGISEAERTLFVIVRSETDRRILSSLVTNLVLSSKQICDRTSLAKSTVSEHIAELLQIGIIKTRQVSETGTSFELEHPEQIRSLLRSLNPGLQEKVTDRFIDLWNF
jgi:predicted transcriptional regulator